MPFDFFVPQYNTCIEFQGLQHFKSKHYWGGESGLEYRRKNDQIKKNFCIDNEYVLLYITYKDDIEETLNNFFEGIVYGKKYANKRQSPC